MNKTVKCKEISKTVKIPASKSWAHRLLIVAALGKNKVTVICDGISDDIQATMDCLESLGAKFLIKNGEIEVNPINREKYVEKAGDSLCEKKLNDEDADGLRHLYCKESGSTLRFMLPIVGALGANVAFHMEGRLKDRPLTDLVNVLSEKGMTIRKEDDILFAKGQLIAGDYSIRGDVSSQFISGLLMALPILSGNSKLTVTGEIQSGKYIEITESALSMGEAQIIKKGNAYEIFGRKCYNVPDRAVAESDWSSASFFLCMGALSEKGVIVKGMNPDSIQGDREIIGVLKQFGANVIESDDEICVKKGILKGIELDASEIPDLVPVISAVASLAEGTTRIYNAERLRLKESDRIASTAAMIRSLGGEVSETEDGLLIVGKKKLSGGTVDSYKDHRIAMSAAVAAAGCENDVTVTDAECTDKSFKNFWNLLQTMEE